MGVKHLWELLDSCKKTLPLHCLQNKRVCIDLSCWVVQLHKVNKSHCPLNGKLYLQGLFHRLRALLALNCSLIFVSDGSIPAIKLSTYWRRLNCGVEVPHHEVNSEKVTSLRRNMGSEFSVMIKEAKFMALALGIPCLDGVEEAEAQCALLNSESLCDGCFTSDSDVFLFGARTVYRDICLGEGGHVVCYEMADIESKLGFGRNSLISLALLLGSDYSSGVRGMGPETACQIVKSTGDTFILQRIISEGLSFGKKKSSKKHIAHEKNMNAENIHNSQKDNIIQQVTNAYLNPKCHPADSTMVLRVLGQHQFQRAKVQQLCFQFFEWPPEKTDDYVLPKIAERELRRFANLRLASSDLGVELLDKMPVKCPVSGIVKRRKSQGREYFEVLWDNLDGITSSAVPADLIESACPEKIVEFEKKAQAKKQNKHNKREPKKPENKVSLAEIEVRLQNLMLEIESRSSAAQSTSFPSSENKKVDGLVVMDREVESSSHCCRREEVIDLVTPQATKAVSRCMEAVDVISLSDSESEVSPEHDRRSKELRCFLAARKKDGNF